MEVPLSEGDDSKEVSDTDTFLARFSHRGATRPERWDTIDTTPEAVCDIYTPSGKWPGRAGNNRVGVGPGRPGQPAYSDISAILLLCLFSGPSKYITTGVVFKVEVTTAGVDPGELGRSVRHTLLPFFRYKGLLIHIRPIHSIGFNRPTQVFHHRTFSHHTQSGLITITMRGIHSK